MAVPIFIGGAPRSGTTLLLRMLGRHPEVAAIYESKVGPLLVDWLEALLDPADPEGPWASRLSEYFTREDLYRSFGGGLRALFDGWASGQGRARWVEKTPRNTILLPELFALMPDLRFVHVIRDGRDVATSMPKLRSTPQTIPECARLWRRYVRCGRGAASARPGQCLEVRYEDLVLRTEPTLHGVCAFLDLDYEPAMADLEGLKVSLFVENWGEAASPETPLGRWRRVPEFPREEFQRAAGDLLVELGYEAGPDW